LSASRKHGRGRVLVVDDDQLILNARARLLKHVGYEVMGCTLPEEALTVFAEDPFAYDAIISDFRMPAMNGLQLCERLVELRTDVPILLVSGYVDEIDLQRAEEIGIGGGVLSKPLSAEQFAAWLDAAVSQS
jgi:two-component system cell cycle sensor histidine kinase/response regulator CckA